MGSNPGYLPKSFLLYVLFIVHLTGNEIVNYNLRTSIFVLDFMDTHWKARKDSFVGRNLSKKEATGTSMSLRNNFNQQFFIRFTGTFYGYEI